MSTTPFFLYKLLNNFRTTNMQRQKWFIFCAGWWSFSRTTTAIDTFRNLRSQYNKLLGFQLANRLANKSDDSAAILVPPSSQHRRSIHILWWRIAVRKYSDAFVSQNFTPSLHSRGSGARKFTEVRIGHSLSSPYGLDRLRLAEGQFDWLVFH